MDVNSIRISSMAICSGPSGFKPSFFDAHSGWGCFLLIQSEVLNMMKPGTSAEEMGYKKDQVKLLGHGIGLELDEWPIFAKGLKNPILPGMTFALEPKFVFPEGAIGTENSFVMTTDGPQYLSVTPDVITYLK